MTNYTYPKTSSIQFHIFNSYLYLKKEKIIEMVKIKKKYRNIYIYI
jgi:hypothetical protein